jgi:hypothetical protein
LADKEPAIEAEIDVDALDDAAFADLKGKMAGEIDTGEAQEPEKATEAPKVAETDKPAPEPNAAKAEDDDDPKSETVPHGQFHRERERRKEAERLKAESDERFAKLAARVAELTAVKEEPKADAEKDDLPDEANPLEQIAWLVKEVREGRMSREEAQKQAREEGERHEYAQRIKAVEDQFKATTPDYDAALQFAAQSRDEELQLMYPLSTPEQRQQFVLREWGQITQQALQAGFNPAERAYQFAVKRGYRKAEPEPTVESKTAVEEISEREETRKAALSLGKTGGGVTQTGAISPEQLLDMTDDEFAAYKAKHGSVARAFAA